MSIQAPPMKPIEMIAQGLQGLVHEAAETAAQKVKEEIRKEFGPRFDRMDARLDGMDARLDGMDGRLGRMDIRLDRQDETLRMVWKQVKGNGKLPIDDPLP